MIGMGKTFEDGATNLPPAGRFLGQSSSKRTSRPARSQRPDMAAARRCAGLQPRRTRHTTALADAMGWEQGVLRVALAHP